MCYLQNDLQFPVIQSNTIPGVAVKIFYRCDKIHNQLEGRYFR